MKTNLIVESNRLHNNGAKGLCAMINESLKTQYRETDFYAWSNGRRKMPNTVQRLLREFVIRSHFKKDKASAVIEMITPPALRGEI